VEALAAIRCRPAELGAGRTFANCLLVDTCKSADYSDGVPAPAKCYLPARKTSYENSVNQH